MAKVDYDPVKAHEYYMKHRKLKGKTRSTKGFNTTQKEQWEYAKSQLSDQYSKSIEDIDKDRQKKMDDLARQLSEQRKELTERAKEAIRKLKESMQYMDEDHKAAMRDKIGGMIEDIKADLKAKQEAMTTRGRWTASRISKEARLSKQDEKAKYESGLDEALSKIGKGAK